MDLHPKQNYKYCPRCGTHVHFNEQNMSLKCNNCGFHLFINASTAVVVLITDENNRLLVTKRAFNPGKGQFDLPGGFVDPGENAEEAAKREITEELQLNINTIRYLGTHANQYPFSGITVYTCDIIYNCTVDTFDSLQSGDDVSAVQFMTQDEIELDAFPFESVRFAIEEFYINKQHNDN